MNRPNLSSEVQTELRRRIISGELPAATRLNEVALAEQLGVSRTPIREALSQLASESFVEVIPRRGFFVTDLSGDEVRQLYPIRQILDPEALRLAGIPEPGAIDALDRLNREIAAETRPESLITLDDRWHLELLAGCPNLILLDLIRQFMRRTLRYELAYMGDDQNVTVAVAEHEVILDRLRAGDLDGACAGLRRNMESATEPLLRWLGSRQDPST